jgi:hypothetical protein
LMEVWQGARPEAGRAFQGLAIYTEICIFTNE